ncbi:MAG: threonine--tRNA ligase [Planctomycetes bacterium]|nr:threonine--tRNA ligase [Planctomycetota bacterium]
MSEKEDNLYKIRHSLAHVCAQAVQRNFPDVQFGFGPPTDDGFYYDFDFGETVLEEKDLKKIEKSMKKIISQNQDFERIELSEEQAKARALEEKQSYKISQIDNLKTKGVSDFSYYVNGPFSDLCEGPHVSSTKELPVKAFKLSAIAGAYWLGSEKNKMLTRIYAYAFETQEQLQDYLAKRKLAEERDHKKLGKELGIFMISDTVGKGLPLWLPNGCIIRDEIEKYAVEMEFKYGYKRVSTPHITRSELYYKSQHLPAYKESMFPPMVVEEESEDGQKEVKEEYYLKPMNCPHHHMIFDNNPVSYRQLPMRLAEYGTCYRFERSGELSGLLRVRSLCMNDAHIYLAEDQIREEFKKTMKMYQEFYATFKLEHYSYRLSLRGQEKSEKYQGDPAMWDRAEEMLADVLDELNIPYERCEDEAAFYGPKLDVQFKNLIGREETVSTIQLDFLSPENFDLKYVGQDGEEHRPVIIHRAPLSTHERFISFLIEYYGGAFPTWCSPEQVVIIPVRDDIVEYAKEIEAQLFEKQIRVSVDESNNSLNKKVRTHVTAKVPNILILGDRERENREVTWRRYGSKEQETMGLEAFKETLISEITERKAQA